MGKTTIERWYYTHADQTRGPVTTAQLRQLAAVGQLLSTDLLWPEGQDRGQGVAAQSVLDLSTSATPPERTPDWLHDVRSAETNPPPRSKAPDWLNDVRAAEKTERAVLPEEVAKKILDELETAAEPEPMTEFIPEPDATRSCPFVIGTATTKGRVRQRNEDSLIVQQCTWYNLDERHDAALIVVADGMGGHQAGERASKLVIRTMGHVLSPLLAAALDGQAPEPATLGDALESGLREANRLIRETAKDNAACKGMGATVVALLVWDGRACIRLVGDCRVYHWRAGQLTQVTRDQTLVERMVELGQLTPQEAATHPRRNEVSQAVGKFHLLEPARYELTLEAGDWLVACCDGLQAHVEDLALQSAIEKRNQSAIALAKHLVRLANRGGGSDNCTVATVHFEG
jgi:PPM family protein phosphatase